MLSNLRIPNSRAIVMFTIKSKITLIIILFCSILSSRLAYSQIFNARIYDKSDGMPSNLTSSTAQDDDGLIWVGTTGGVAVYDGVKWTTFPDSLHLPNSAHTRIRRLKDGSMVVAGYSEQGFSINIYKNGIWSKLAIDPRLAEIRQLNNIEFCDGNLNGTYHLSLQVRREEAFLYSFETETWKKFSMPATHKNYIINQAKLLFDKLYIFYGNGVMTWDGANYKELMEPEANVPDRKIYTGVGRVADTLFVQSSNWFGYITDQKTKVVSRQIGKPAFPVPNMTRIQNHIFFTDEYTFYKYEIKSEELQPFKLSVADVVPYYISLFGDLENNLWISTRRGLLKVNNFSFMGFDTQSGLLEKSVASLLEIEKGKIIAAGNRSYSIIKDMSVKSYSLETDLPQYKTRITDIEMNENGDIFLAGTNMGFGILQKNNTIRWVKATHNITTVNASTEGKIYVGSDAGPLYFYQGKKLIEDSIGVDFYIRTICKLADGTMLLAGNKGIVKVQPEGQVIPISGVNKFYGIYAILETEDKVLLGTESGLYELKGNSILKVSLHNFEFDHAIYSIIKTRKGDFWFGTDDGVIVYADGRESHFTKAEGLLGHDVGRNALLEDEDGKIWIGTEAGISVYDADNDFSNGHIHHAKILTASNHKKSFVAPDEKIEVGYRDNDLMFEFRALSFYEEDEVNYRYRLLGHEGQWHYINSKLYVPVTYENVPYNSTYQFEFQARRSQQAWEDSVFSGTVYVKNPFYMNWWFISLVVGVIGTLGYGIRVFKDQTDYNKLLETELEKRAQEIRKTYNKIEEQNIALKESERLLEEDIVKRKMYEKKLEQSNSELSTLFFKVSHDLKGPLTSFKGLLGSSGNKRKLEESYLYLDLVGRSLMNLDEILDDFLTTGYVKEAKIKPEEIDLNQLIGSILYELNIQENFSKIAIETNNNIKNKVFFDRKLLKAIFRNLIQNAIKYQAEKNAKLNIDLIEYKNYIKFIFEDNGIGISEKYHKSVFDMFFRATGNYDGSGLGLYIVRTAVEKMGGKIVLDSRENKGTTITITFVKDDYS